MFKDLFRLSGKVIIITGGMGYLGRAISEGLSEFGAHVIVLGRRNLQGSIANIEYIECDVQNDLAFQRVVDDVLIRHGKIDALVNNANSSNRETWGEIDAEKWRAGFEGTLTHVFSCSKIVAAHMAKNGQGVIVNNASLFGILAPKANMYPEGIRGPAAHHAAAKAGVIQLTKFLAAELAKDGIRVNVVTPGWFPQKRGPDRPDFMANVNERIPMGRIGQASEIVGAFVFLLSDASSYITGQNIIVDGGYSIW
jgi:NAD(P)-dependent dehydrogenase (short-subunit alcohol dehydrogenase family)